MGIQIKERGEYMSAAGRRGKYVWLGLLGIIVLIVSLASVSGAATISPAVALGLVVAYIGLLLFSMGSINLSGLGKSVKPLKVSGRMTPAARRAWQKARTRPEYGSGADDTLVDIGYLLNERRRDGGWDRRIGTSASFDDGFLQPYAKLHVTPDLADRLVMVDFELYDRSGRLQFSHRMEEYLREGENLVLCDRQMVLRGNEDIGRAGTWDLRIKVDGALVAIHEFNMSASDEERRQYAPRAAPRADLLAGDDDAVPVSLEDLLREQARRSSQGSQR
jgi:hypothetical protein